MQLDKNRISARLALPAWAGGSCFGQVVLTPKHPIGPIEPAPLHSDHRDPGQQSREVWLSALVKVEPCPAKTIHE